MSDIVRLSERRLIGVGSKKIHQVGLEISIGGQEVDMCGLQIR